LTSFKNPSLVLVPALLIGEEEQGVALRQEDWPPDAGVKQPK